MKIREHFGRQLETLREDLLRLGNMVEHALQRAMRSLETWNVILAAQVIDNDTHIDLERHNVEERVITLIATQQPVATDLRLLGTVFATASELERIGDYASTIARRVQKMSRLAMLVTPPPALNEMAVLSRKMLNIALEAFLRQDVAMAKSLSNYDIKVDALEDRLRTELLDIARKDPQRLEAAIDILNIVHALERVADRATNIGERVIYLETCIIEELNP